MLNSLDKPPHPDTAQPVAAPALQPAPGSAPPRPEPPGDADALGRAGQAGFLADVLRHGRLGTPFTLGVFGAAGAGKSAFLRQIATAADGAPAPGAIARVLVVPVDAGRAGPPATVLADAVLTKLTAEFPDLAADLAHAGADPAEALRDANTALDDLRRRHQSERDTLDQLGSREARMLDAVLDAPGSTLDAYARGHRSALEGALRQFGFGGNDPIGTFKAFAGEAAQAPGAGARLLMSLRALWVYKGQARLLVLAGLLMLVAWGLSAVAADQAGWVDALRNSAERAGPAADWAQGHAHWLGPLHSGAVGLAVVLLLLAGLRALRFLRPIFKGAALLLRDVNTRGRDLQGLIAHQTRRVDGLAGEVEAAALRVAEAEKRARAGVARPASGTRVTRGDDDGHALFAALGVAMNGGGEAPGRVVLLLDNLDRRPGEAAAAFLETLHGLMAPGLACVVAADRSRLLDGFGDTDPAGAAARLERCVELGYRLDAGPGAAGAWSRLARALLGEPSGEAGAGTPAARADLDRPWLPREADTVAALAAFAGNTPRAVSRFVNAYRIARADPQLGAAPAPVFTALALALALEAHGYPDDLEALGKASLGEAPGASTLLREALAAARQASGAPVELAQARTGLEVARRYALRA